MKKLVLLLVALVVSVATVSARDVISRNINDLPNAALATVNDNFKAKVSVIKIDKGITGVSEYEVILTDGTEITFDRNGNWKEVEVPGNKQVPDYFVPKTIRDYIKKNNNNKKVVGIEKNGRSYEVQLENGIEMKFDRAGNFIRYDK